MVVLLMTKLANFDISNSPTDAVFVQFVIRQELGAITGCRKAHYGLDKLVILLRVRGGIGLSPRLAFALLDWRQTHLLALAVKNLILILHQLDSLALFESLDRLCKSGVQNLAAMRWRTRGVERVNDVGVDWRRRCFLVVGGGIGRVVGYSSALEHVLLARKLDTILKGGHRTLGFTALGVVVAASC